MPSLRRSSLESQCIAGKEPREIHSPPIRQRQKQAPLRRIIKGFMIELGLIGISTMSGSVLSNFEPHHKQSSQPQTMKSEIRLSRTCLPTFFNKLEYISERIQEAMMRIIARNRILAKIAKRLTPLLYHSSLMDPPPHIFLLSLLLFIFALASLRNYHRNDHYQDLILGIGTAVGVLTGIARGDVMEMKGWLVWSIILAVVVSSVAHRLGCLWPDPKPEPEPEPGVGM